MKILIGLIVSVLVVSLALWEIKWILSMQSLTWQKRVSEVAKFTCQPFQKDHSWTAVSLTLNWKCVGQ